MSEGPSSVWIKSVQHENGPPGIGLLIDHAPFPDAIEFIRADIAAERERKLVEALRPFADLADVLDVQTDGEGGFFWGGIEQRQSIHTWIGPTDLGKVRAIWKELGL